MKNIKNYARPESLKEAWELNQKKQNCILGGMLWLRLGEGEINTAIDLGQLGLDKIEESEEQFSIGAMVTLRELELHVGLNGYTQNAVKEALKDIVGVQFRNMATIGGSIWGRFGFSDVLTLFLAMDTYVELYEGGILSLGEFASRKPDRDILVRLIVKKEPMRVKYTSMRNQRTDFPVIACAVSQRKGTYYASVGARPQRAICIADEEGLLKEGLHKEGVRAFASYVAQKAPTESNVRGSSAYRTHLIQGLTERLLEELMEERKDTQPWR